MIDKWEKKCNKNNLRLNVKRNLNVYVNVNQERNENKINDLD